MRKKKEMSAENNQRTYSRDLVVLSQQCSGRNDFDERRSRRLIEVAYFVTRFDYSLPCIVDSFYGMAASNAHTQSYNFFTHINRPTQLDTLHSTDMLQKKKITLETVFKYYFILRFQNKSIAFDHGPP